MLQPGRPRGARLPRKKRPGPEIRWRRRWLRKLLPRKRLRQRKRRPRKRRHRNGGPAVKPQEDGRAALSLLALFEQREDAAVNAAETVVFRNGRDFALVKGIQDGDDVLNEHVRLAVILE